MRKFLSYAKSHIYDIHAIVVSVGLVILMICIRKPLCRKIKESIDSKMADTPGLKRQSLVRKWNILLLLLLMLLSIAGFAIFAVISPFIDFSLPSGIMSGVYTLCGCAFWDQLMPMKRDTDK